MGLLSKLKSALGIGDADRRTTRDTTVPVEREPEIESESVTDRMDAEPRTTSRSGTTGGPETSETSETSEAPMGSATAGMETTEPGDGSAAAKPARAGQAGEPVDSIKGIGPAYSQQLSDVGVETTAELAAADAAQLAAQTGIPEIWVREWIDRARAR